MSDAILRDTRPEALRVQRRVLGRMTGEERLRLAVGMSEDVRRGTEDGIRHRHPEYSAREVALAAIRLALPPALFKAAFPGVEIEP